MKRIWLAAVTSATLLSVAPASWAADAVLRDAEAPPRCEWRKSGTKADAAPTLYCPDGDKGLRYARIPTGFRPEVFARARAGEPEAMTMMGLLYLDGAPFLRDAAEGRSWMLKAAEAGSVDARYNLGLMLDQGGPGIDKDHAAAAGWYRKAAEQGDAQSMVNLADMLLAGRGVTRDDAEAMRLMRAADTKVEARYNVAAMTFDGRGVPADKASGVSLLRKAADDGSDFAAWRLGRLYATGDGVTADRGEAIRWTRKSGEKTARLAGLVLSLTYLLLPDMTARQAREGDARAQLSMAVVMLEGKRVKRDPKAAAVLLASAAKAGIPLAAYKLGELYADGDGVGKDPEMALTLLTMGVETQFDQPWDTYESYSVPAAYVPPPAPKK